MRVAVVGTGYMGLSVTAVYNNYFYVYNVALGIVWILCSAVQASVGNSIVSEPVEKNYHDLRKIELISGCAICVSASLMLCLYQPFMEIWTGGRLLLPERDMVLFVLYFYCISINGGRNLYFQGLGLWWEARVYSLLEMAGNLLLNIWWGKLWGVTGVLLAMILTIVVLNFICVSGVLFKRYFGRSPRSFFADRVYYTLATAVACAMAYAGCHFIGMGGVGGLSVRAGVASVAAGGVFLAFCMLFRRRLFFESLDMVMSMWRR